MDSLPGNRAASTSAARPDCRCVCESDRRCRHGAVDANHIKAVRRLSRRNGLRSFAWQFLTLYIISHPLIAGTIVTGPGAGTTALVHAYEDNPVALSGSFLAY